MTYQIVSFDYNTIITDQTVNSEAIYQVLGRTIGPECLIDVLLKFSERMKIYNVLKTAVRKQKV